MNGNLILSSDRAVCTSTYPEYDYATVTVTLPAAMTGATFESVAFTYSQSQTSGTGTIKFSDTRQDVSNARILERLQNGETEFTLLFSFRSASGERTKTWSSLQIAVTYQPAAKLSGTQTAPDGSTVFWAIDTASLARGETVPVLLTITAAQDCDTVSAQMRAGTSGALIGNGAVMTIPAGRATTTTLTITLPGGFSMAERVMAAQMHFTLRRTAGGNVETPWTAIGLNLVRERTNPALTVTFTDLGEGLRKVAAFVQGISRLRLNANVVLDTAADSAIAIKSRELILNGNAVDMPGNQVEFDTANLTGSVSYSLTVRDTYGKSRTVSGSIRIEPYSPPVISALTLERYIETHPSTGGTEYVPDDGSDTVSIKRLTYSVKPVNSRNAYTLTASWDGGSMLVYSFPDGAESNDIVDDREIFDQVSFSPSREYLVTFTLADNLGGTATATFTLPMAGGIFNIEKGGVAVGKRVTGTALEPKFECAYPATFEGGVFDGDGNRIGSVDYILPETRIGTFLGKALYRKGVQLDTYSSSSSTLTQVDFQVIPTRVTKIEGFVMTTGYGDLPLNCYHSSSIRTFCRPDGLTGRLIGYSTNVNSGAVIFMEYTKD